MKRAQIFDTNYYNTHIKNTKAVQNKKMKLKSVSGRGHDDGFFPSTIKKINDNASTAVSAAPCLYPLLRSPATILSTDGSRIHIDVYCDTSGENAGKSPGHLQRHGIAAKTITTTTTLHTAKTKKN